MAGLSRGEDDSDARRRQAGLRARHPGHPRRASASAPRALVVRLLDTADPAVAKVVAQRWLADPAGGTPGVYWGAPGGGTDRGSGVPDTASAQAQETGRGAAAAAVSRVRASSWAGSRDVSRPAEQWAAFWPAGPLDSSRPECADQRPRARHNPRGGVRRRLLTRSSRVERCRPPAASSRSDTRAWPSEGFLTEGGHLRGQHA